MPCLERLVDGWIVAEKRLREAVLPRGELPVAVRTRRDDDVEVVAKRLEVAKGNPVGKTAVEILTAVDSDGPRDDWHRGRSAYPLERPCIGLVEPSVFRFASRAVGGDNMEFHWIRGIRRGVEDVKLHWKLAVAEVGVEKIARSEKRRPRAVAWIAREALVVANHAPDLPALVVAAKACACRDADDSVELHAVFHEDVEYAGRKQPAQSPAFKYKSAFHGVATGVPAYRLLYIVLATSRAACTSSGYGTSATLRNPIW